MSFDISEFNKPKSDQLNSEDLLGSNLIIAITKVEKTGNIAQPLSFFFIGDNGKPYKPCKSMRRIIRASWGKMSGAYHGKRLELRRDPDVKLGKLNVGGIRIKKVSDITNPENLLTKEGKTYSIILTESQNKKVLYQFEELSDTSAPITPELAADGLAAAMKGVDAYTAWKDGLPPEQKELIRVHHSGWAKIAAGVKS